MATFPEVRAESDWLCKPALVLTIYLPAPPTATQALAAWRVYALHCPAASQRFITHRQLADYDALPSQPTEADVEPYAAPLDLWRDQGMVVWDGGEGSCWSLSVQGMFEPDGPAQASFCQVIFPDGTAPEVAFAMAAGMADHLDILSGHCGYSALFKSTDKAGAFDQIYAWAKRFLGLEVEDMNRTASVVLDGIKGANWLTLIGPRWIPFLNLAKRPSGATTHGLEVHQRGRAILLAAGPRPVLADRNRGEFPLAYAEAEQLIAPMKIDRHPEFAGRFDEELATMPWLRRLLDPAGW